MLHYTVQKGLRIAHATLMYTKFASFRIVPFFLLWNTTLSVKACSCITLSLLRCVAISAYTSLCRDVSWGVGSEAFRCHRRVNQKRKERYLFVVLP